jgi:hypothetical protein
VVDVVGDDGAPARDLIAHELGRDRRFGRLAPKFCPGCWRSIMSAIFWPLRPPLARSEAMYCSRFRFSRMATNSISGVMMPRRA